MRRSLLLLVILSAWGCATPQLTYDRYDERHATYVNDTAGFAMTMGREWNVNVDGDAVARLFNLIPVPLAREISLRAAAASVGLWVETSRVPSTLSVEQLPAFMRASDAEMLNRFRYQPISQQTKEAHGIRYVEWIYRLTTPEVDRTLLEGLFLRGTYAVRVRALSNTENFEEVRPRVERLLASLTAIEDAAGLLKDATQRNWEDAKATGRQWLSR